MTQTERISRDHEFRVAFDSGLPTQTELERLRADFPSDYDIEIVEEEN